MEPVQRTKRWITIVEVPYLIYTDGCILVLFEFFEGKARTLLFGEAASEWVPTARVSILIVDNWRQG